MHYRKIGLTDIEVSTVCCGTMAMCPHPTYGDPDDARSIAAVHAALDAGINFFDTAEGYGEGYAERVLGQALQGRGDEAVIATKVSRQNCRPEDVERSCEQSLKRLRTDCIDLYQVHWPNHEVPFAQTVGALQKLKASGKIREWGVSNFGKFDLRDLLEVDRPESNQVPYSLLWRVIEHDILPACRNSSIGVICYSPLAQGILTGKFEKPQNVPAQRQRPRYCDEDVIDLSFQVVDEVRAVSDQIGEREAVVALAWVLARPGVTSVIAGARSPEQVTQNARAGELVLSEGAVDRLNRASLRLKSALDTNPDMWQSGEESRYR